MQQMPVKLGFAEKLHMRHRLLRCRFKSEAPSIRFLLQSPFAGRTLVDIGANRGVFSYYMSRSAGPRGLVYAFEAQPELGPHLEGVVQTFGLDNVRVVNQGLSSRPGVLRMRRPQAGSGRASFDHGADDCVEELDVPVTTLDLYFEGVEHEPIGFIKCDVEGHELEVFRGARRILSEDGPVLLFECHHEEARDGRLFEFLKALGYDGVFFQVDPEDHRTLWHNTRGRYLHYSQFAQHAYPRIGVRHRNYIFMKDRERLQGMLGGGEGARRRA
jgi:FkbM family methyltransferase